MENFFIFFKLVFIEFAVVLVWGFKMAIIILSSLFFLCKAGWIACRVKWVVAILIILGLLANAHPLLVALETRAFIGVVTVHHLPDDLQVVEADSFVNGFGGHGAFCIDFKLFVILVLWADHHLVCQVAHFLHKNLVIFCLFDAHRKLLLFNEVAAWLEQLPFQLGFLSNIGLVFTAFLLDII
jgi:hypothetical protein